MRTLSRTRFTGAWFRRPQSKVALGMNKSPAVRLLQVTVTAQEPTLWKWHVSEGDIELAHGYATSRETAQFDGDTQLFVMLSEQRK